MGTTPRRKIIIKSSVIMKTPENNTVPLRFVELPPERIFNWLDPFNNTARGICKHHQDILDSWWSDETVKLRKEIAKIWTEEFDNITGHFSKLRESIEEKGILTPISTVAGPPRDQYCRPRHGKTTDHFPPEDQDNLDQVLYTQPFGGSRLTIACDLNLEKVPCVVHDFTNLFPEAPVVTAKNFQTWFNKNEYFFCNATPYLRLKQHSHMDGKFNGMNGHTRSAQQAAMAKTKERLGL